MRYLLTLLSILSLASCKRSNESIPYTNHCLTREYLLSLSDFNAADLDTTIIFTYHADSSFTAPTGMVQLSAYDRPGGTSWGAVNNAYDFEFTAGNDYMIVLPNSGDTIRLWGLEIIQRTQQTFLNSSGRPATSCQDSLLRRCTVNDTFVNCKEQDWANTTLAPLYLVIPPPQR